jgi:hypothetical protein
VLWNHCSRIQYLRNYSRCPDEMVASLLQVSKSRLWAVTAPIENRVCPPPLAQIDEAYRVPQIEPVDDGPAQLPFSQIDLEARRAPLPPIRIQPVGDEAYSTIQ